MAADSPHVSDQSPTASSQQLSSVSASTARQLAAELAVSVTLSDASQDQSSSASGSMVQSSASRLQGTSQKALQSSVARGGGNPHQQGYPQLLAFQAGPSQTSPPAAATAAGEADDSSRALCTNGAGCEQPTASYSLSPQLSGSTPELKEAIELSLSHEALSPQQSNQELQHSHERGHDAGLPQPSVSSSPSRQLSASSPELNEAIRMSLSSDFLPEAELESASPSASQAESHCSTSQHAEPEPALTQLRAASASAARAPTSMEETNADEYPAKTSDAMFSHLRSTQCSASDPSSSASNADPLHKQEGQSHAAGPPTAATVPTPEDPTLSLPEPECESRAAPSSPSGQVRADVPQAPNSPATAQDSSPEQSQAHSTHEGQSQDSPVPGPDRPSSSGRTTPAPIHTSSSPKPPKPSPGTAAQIDGDAALALQLQKLELADEPGAAESSAAVPTAEAVDDDVDLAALQDVEVPLVGNQLPLAALVEDYEGSPRVCGNLVPVMQRFPYFRRIRGWLPVNAWLAAYCTQ